MPDFYAVKRLAGSDLGWFKSLFLRYTNTKLKGINLNADVVVDEFYRDLPIIAASKPGNHIKVGVEISGPAAAAGFSGTYKMIRSGGSKNWRLNGMLVSDPPTEPGRFDILRPGDAAVFAFSGRPEPDRVDLVLLAGASSADAVLQRHFDALIPGGTRTMIPLSAANIVTALGLNGVPSDHPLSFLVADPAQTADMDDAAAGGLDGSRSTRARRARKPVTQAELAEARRRNEQTGMEGERLICGHLESLENPNGTWHSVWISSQDALNPYDFECSSIDGAMGNSSFVLDVKSTRGFFGAPLHISMPELIYAADADRPYYLYRVFDLNDDGGHLRISSDIRDWARSIVTAMAGLPPGVNPNAFSIRPDLVLEWGQEIRVTFRDDVDLLD